MFKLITVFSKQQQNLFALKGNSIKNVTSMFTTKRQFNISKYQLSSTQKKPDDLEDDVYNTQQKESNISSEAKASKAFSEFMAKVREMDKEAEKSNPFVTKEDIEKMKNLQKEEKASQITAQTVTQIEESTQKEAAVNFTKGLNDSYFSDFFGSFSSNVDEGVLRLEKELFDQRPNYQQIINGLAGMPNNFVHQYPEGKYLLYKAFTTPQLYKQQTQLTNLMQAQDLSDQRTVINAKTLRLGDIQRDYKKYLDETVFNKPLEAPGYNALLDVCALHFKKRIFKKILTHIVVFRAKLDKTTIDQITQICKDNKLGLTLFEFTYLLANDSKSTITQQQFVQLLNNVKSFEDVNEEVETLVRVYLNANLNRKFEIKIIEGYINQLIREKSVNKLMSMLERLRDFFFARKVPFDDKISSEANTAVADKFKQEQRDIVQALFRMYMQKLTSARLNIYARPLFQELTNMKYKLNEQDYIQGFKSMEDKIEDLEDLYESLLEHKIEFGVELIKCLLDIFRKHPKTLAKLQIRVLKEQIYTDKVAIDVNEVNEFAQLFTKNEIPSDFSDLLKYLLKHPDRANDFTKITAYKIMNSVTEEIQKQFMRGLAEALFSSQKQEQIRQQLIQDKLKKRNNKKQEETLNTAQTQVKQKGQQTAQVTQAVNQSQTSDVNSKVSIKNEKSKGKKNQNLEGGKDQKQGKIEKETNPEKDSKLQSEQKVGENAEPTTEEKVEGEVQDNEDVTNHLLQGILKQKMVEKAAKRKVLRKAGVTKFKDIEGYIKDQKAARE